MTGALRARARLAALIAAACCAVPSTAAALVSTGRSGWDWSAPAPQGEDLNALVLTGDTGYAAGAFGTLLRTTDAGQTWTGLASGTTETLGFVGAPGSVLVAAGGCVVRRSVDGGATVTAVSVAGSGQGCGSGLSAVAFADADHGLLAFANGVLLATADGGVSLSRRTPAPSATTDLVATSATTAFATTPGGIYRTTDGASSWTLVAGAPRTFAVPRLLRSVTFASPSVGYAAGDAGAVLRTTDGGATWTSPDSSAPALDLTGVRCASESLCLFTTTSPGTLVRTPDAGRTYQQVGVAAGVIRAVAFASPSRAVAVGAGGATVLSDDGGLTWRPVGGAIGALSGVTGQPGTVPQLASVVARPGGFAYAVAPSGISVTLDGGATWRTFGIPTPQDIVLAAMADPQTGWAQDAGGSLWRTVDGGTSWRLLDPGVADGPLGAIIPLSGGRVLLVTQGGVVARSTDGGVTFAPVSDPVVRRSGVLRSPLIRSAGGGGRAFLISPRGVLQTRDGGRSWSALRLPRLGRRAPTIARADCAPPASCWVLTTGSRLYRTTDGRRWTDVSAGVGAPMRDVLAVVAGGPGEAFLVERPGGAFPDAGTVLHTADGGRTWAPQVTGAREVLSLDAVPGRAWALGPAATLLTTTTGGAAPVASRLTITASPRRITRPTRVTVTGRLAGATGGEQVSLFVSGRPQARITVASSGTFTATVPVRRTTTFVAQWAGDGVRAGAGTPALVVERGPRRR